MILLVEHPIFSFELYCSIVLLVSSLLIIEREEQGIQVKMREVLNPVIHGHGGERQVLIFKRHSMSGLIHLLVPYFRHISIRRTEQIHGIFVIFEVWL